MKTLGLFMAHYLPGPMLHEVMQRAVKQAAAQLFVRGNNNDN